MHYITCYLRDHLMKVPDGMVMCCGLSRCCSAMARMTKGRNCMFFYNLIAVIG
jgi:hypothetical protein